MAGYQQFSLIQLQNLFYERVGQNRAFFRLDEVTRILQEALRVFNCLTGFWRDRVSAGFTAANQVWYSVPAGLAYILRVEINQQVLKSSSLYDLDYGRTNWESEVCTQGQLPQAFAPAGTNFFALWPASFAGGESMVVEGVVPAPLLSNTGFVNLGQDEVKAILDYAEHVAQFKEGGQEFQASEVGLKEFLREAGDRNAILMQSSKFRKWMGLTDQKKRPMAIPDAKVGAR